MSATEPRLRARNLRTLAVLAGLFLLPLLLAFCMYYGSDWRPAQRINHGELIIPARPLPAASLSSALPGRSASPVLFRRKWTLVYIGDGRCGPACRQALYQMRQTRLALNSEMTRVVRVFLVTGECCAAEYLRREHPDLLVLDAHGESAGQWLRTFPSDAREKSLYVVDPLGNLLMRYDTRQNPRGLLEDLRKLLMLSHIG